MYESVREVKIHNPTMFEDCGMKKLMTILAVGILAIVLPFAIHTFYAPIKTSIPEPSSLALMCLALLGLYLGMLRKRSS